MKRETGIIGTMARFILGSILFGSVVYGHWFGVFRPVPWIIGLIIFPSLFIGWHYWRMSGDKKRFQYTGGFGYCLNIVVFWTLYLTHLFPTPFAYMSDGVLIFYGVSMVLAALRGYAGCEVLAISNWLLKRDDQIGCIAFAPLDHIDRIILERFTNKKADDVEQSR